MGAASDLMSWDLDLSEWAYQKQVGRLDLFEESIFYTRYVDGQPVSCIEVAPDAVASALSGVPINTGLLPKNTLFFSRRGGQERVAIYVPPQVRDLHLVDDRTYRIPLPPLVFLGQSLQYQVFAVKQYPTQKSERLFFAPFPNVHLGQRAGSGHICTGNAEFPACSAATIDKALDVFFESSFNGHLVQGRSRQEDEDICKLWATLEASEAIEYPLPDLIKTSLTLGDLMGGDSGT